MKPISLVWHLLRLTVVACALALTSPAVVATAEAPPHKKLIEFGWDEPSTRFMRDHIAELKASPFDGCVFHVDYTIPSGDSGSFTWRFWGHRRYKPEHVSGARADLAAIQFGRFTENFLRINVTPADLDWFEDHNAVLSNLELASRLAKDGKCRGVLLDVEQYEGKLWDFRAQVKRNPRTWMDYRARVHSIGSEVMRALERGFPGLTVFMTFAYSHPLEETGVWRRDLTTAEYGLLVPFIDGMVAAASAKAVIVDGHELSYAYRETERFAAKADSMRRGVTRLAAQPERYRQLLSVAFGIWLDNEWQRNGWDAVHGSRNYFTPESFGRSVQAAFDHADRYVWIYSEQPRWWSESRRPLRLPTAYDSVLRAVRR